MLAPKLLMFSRRPIHICQNMTGSHLGGVSSDDIRGHTRAFLTCVGTGSSRKSWLAPSKAREAPDYQPVVSGLVVEEIVRSRSRADTTIPAINLPFVRRSINERTLHQVLLRALMKPEKNRWTAPLNCIIFGC